MKHSRSTDDDSVNQALAVKGLTGGADEGSTLLGGEVVRLAHASVDDGLHAGAREGDDVVLEGGDVWG